MSAPPGEEIRRECWDEALHCYGTAAIFQHRAANLRRRIRFLTLLGLLVPVAAGAAALTWGAGSTLTTIITGIAGILGFVQVVMSVVSLSYKWDDDFAYSTESASANMRLHERYVELAKRPPDDALSVEFQLIRVESRARSESDERQHITDNEKRYAMRVALRQLQRACAGCKQVPKSHESTNCSVCGNFSLGRWLQ